MMKMNHTNNTIKKYIFTLLAVFVMGMIFLKSFYWPVMGEKRKLVICALTIFFVFFIPILAIRIRGFNILLEKIEEYFRKVLKTFKGHKWKVIRILSVALLGMGLAYITSYLISKFIFGTAFNIRLFYTFVTLFFLAICISILWKSASRKPEKIFVVVALSMGLFCIGVTPDRVGVSWDDQIHYERTLEISNVFNGIMYEVDEKNIANAPFYGGARHAREIEFEYINDLEESYASKKCEAHDFKNYNVWSVSYIPSAIGIILGRGLGLSYIGVFNMGRFLSLLMYVLLIYFAIKRIKYGKILIAAIGLIPTTIFMASSYSYDPWITGFTILGFSYFFAELQDDAPLKNKNIIIMIGAIVLGCLPKAIYFPLLFPLLFMPKKKFKSSKQRRWYRFAVIGMGLLLVATFLLPMLINGAGTGDVRGGSDVNSTEQIRYILNNPLAYAKTLYTFILEYIALKDSGGMLQVYAYVGNGNFYSTVSLLLIVLAFLDRGENEKNYSVVKGASLVGGTAAIVLSATALYIRYTAVGADNVAGMQGRYLIPTIFPALYALGIGGTTHKINRNAFVCVPMLIIAITFIYNMFAFCVISY